MRLRALIIADSESDALLVAHELRRSRGDVEHEVVAAIPALRAALARRWDIVVCAGLLPGATALEILPITQELAPATPVIAVVGAITEDLTVAVLRAGARDLVHRERLARLGPAVEREVADAEARASATRIEDQLRQANKMEAVGRLAGGVAHDFNNILCVIMSYSETLLEVLEPGEMRDDVEQIRNAGARGAALTRQLLMFNRQQLLEPRVLDLNGVLADLTGALKRLLRDDIALTSIPGPGLGQVRADQGSLEQVVSNLVANARDAMPAGGAITLRTANVELDRTYARNHLGVTAGRYVMISVSDTGTGIDPATQARIFEPFFVSKDRGRGSGLGLAMVFGIVQQNHGHVEVESTPASGTSFRVYLPRIDAATTPRRLRSRPTTLYGSETILLLEEDDQVRAVALAILKKLGYALLAARNGDEAQHHCQAHPQRIHLLLTDVATPGSAGPDLVRQLQRLRPEMKVLCMSGYSDDVRPGAAPLDAEIAYLQKPFTAEALSTRVRRVIDGDREPGAS